MANKNLLNTLSYVFFLALGILLFYYTFQKSDFSKIYHNLQNINYNWLSVVLLSTLTAYWARNERWYMLLKASNVHPSRWQVFNAMMLGYFVNLSIPRLGEISRSIALQKQTKTSFNTTIGTVIIERIIDIISLLIVVIFVSFLEYEKIKTFLVSHIFPIFFNLKNILLNKIELTVIGFLIISIILFVFRDQIISLFKKLTSIKFISDFKTGISSILHLENKGLFLLYTLVIWSMYFCTSYFCFFTIESGKSLSIEAGVTVLAFGSIAKSLPIQGGSMGAYHFTVAQILLLFGMSTSTGESIALIIHSTQLIFQIVIGGICSLLFFTSKKGIKKEAILK